MKKVQRHTDSSRCFAGNEFIFEGNICRIKLYDVSGNQRIEEGIIDSEDYDLVKGYRWFLHSGGYIWNNAERISLQSLIMGFKLVDHKDRNGLNNRKNNLRKCTQSQNCMNRRRPTNNVSGHKGVSWEPKADKWRSRIMCKGVPYNLGLYKDKANAVDAYTEKAIELFGEFAKG